MSDTIETVHLNEVIANHTRDMSGRTAVITGTTSGTGFVCARELAKQGAHVILLNRPSERASAALDSLKKAAPNGSFEAIDCDLQDFSSVRAATAAIQQGHDRVDVLCNNAGVMALRDLATGDGYDVQMQTNCLSHFLITKELFPLLRNSDDARIVNHSSQARLGPPLEPKYFAKNGGNLGGDGDGAENERFSSGRWARYHQTKLANCAFTYGLHERLKAAGIGNVKALVAHPGLARTQLQVTTDADGGMDASSDFMKQAQSPEDGALGIIRACMDPKAQSGDFYGPEGWTGFPKKLTPEPLLTDPDNLRANWEGCEAAVGRFVIQAE